MRQVWSLGLEGLQRERKEGEVGGGGETSITPVLFCILVAVVFFSFPFSTILWEWGGLSSFLFGWPPRHPVFTCSRTGFLPISQQCSLWRYGQDWRDPSSPSPVPELSSHRQQMSWFLREHVCLYRPLEATAKETDPSILSRPAISQKFCLNKNGWLSRPTYSPHIHF